MVVRTPAAINKIAVEYFEVFPKGDIETAVRQLKLAEMKDRVDVVEILKQWIRYLNICFSKQTSVDYILSLEKFTEKRKYNVNFEAQENLQVNLHKLPVHLELIDCLSKCLIECIDERLSNDTQKNS